MVSIHSNQCNQFISRENPRTTNPLGGNNFKTKSRNNQRMFESLKLIKNIDLHSKSKHNNTIQHTTSQHLDFPASWLLTDKQVGLMKSNKNLKTFIVVFFKGSLNVRVEKGGHLNFIF